MPTMKNRHHADHPVPTLSAALGHPAKGRARNPNEIDTLMQNFRKTGGKAGKARGGGIGSVPGAGEDAVGSVTFPTAKAMQSPKRLNPKMPKSKN
jgi:hypothetical protein